MAATRVAQTSGVIGAVMGADRIYDATRWADSSSCPRHRTGTIIALEPDPDGAFGTADGPAGSVVDLMGSLIKKRRKRMRKKKHKKMLKRTRWQRRAAGK